jgi:hypothetical protein
MVSEYIAIMRLNNQQLLTPYIYQVVDMDTLVANYLLNRNEIIELLKRGMGLDLNEKALYQYIEDYIIEGDPIGIYLSKCLEFREDFDKIRIKIVEVLAKKYGITAEKARDILITRLSMDFGYNKVLIRVVTELLKKWNTIKEDPQLARRITIEFCSGYDQTKDTLREILRY